MKFDKKKKWKYSFIGKNTREEILNVIKRIQQ